MNCFVGTHEMTVSAKKSVTIPKCYREMLGKDVVVLESRDKGIHIYPIESYNSRKIIEDFQEFYIPNPRFITLLDETKFNLSDGDVAFLGDDKLCAILGVCDHIEIYGIDNYRNRILSELKPENVQRMYEILEGGNRAL